MKFKSILIASLVVTVVCGAAIAADSGDTNKTDTASTTDIAQHIQNPLAEDNGGWEFKLMPYAWLPTTLKSKSTISGLSGTVKLDLQDILDNLDMLMFARVEAWKDDKWGLMVHGLMSSPQTWVEMFNDLRGQKEIRENYQFWFFKYPSGLPVVYSSSILRKQLSEIYTQYDPKGQNPYFNNLVLVGHSMGGLLSRTMMQDSEDVFWDAIFKEPIDTLPVSDKDRAFQIGRASCRERV